MRLSRVVGVTLMVVILPITATKATTGTLAGSATLSCKFAINVNSHSKINTNPGQNCVGPADGAVIAALDLNSCVTTADWTWLLRKPFAKGAGNFTMDNIQYEELNTAIGPEFMNGHFHMLGGLDSLKNTSCTIEGTFDYVGIGAAWVITIPSKKAVKGGVFALRVVEPTKTVRCPFNKNPQGSGAGVRILKGIPGAGKTEVWLTGSFQFLC